MAKSVLVFEDNDLLRESVCNLLKLNDQFQPITAYDKAVEVVSLLEKHKPDLIFMDIDMPGLSGIEAVKKIRKVNSGIPVIMLTVFDDNQSVLDAIKAGASGYLLKKHISAKLFDAIEEVLQGGAPMSPTVARMVVNSMQNQNVSNHYNLTPREKEILSSLSKGNSYKLIAAEFNISVDTVRTHIKKIYEKLHVHSQTEAVSKAIQEKLV